MPAPTPHMPHSAGTSLVSCAELQALLTQIFLRHGTSAEASAESPWRGIIRVSRAFSQAQEKSDVPALWGMFGVGAGFCIFYFFLTCFQLCIKSYNLLLC